MKAFKDGLIYFIKTQLMISTIFNLVLAISYLLMVLIRGIVYNLIYNSPMNEGSKVVEYVFFAIPVFVFFVCGLYYKQKKKPDGALARYLPIAFPIIVILFSELFYSKIYVTDFSLPWISMPYNWIFYSPVGYFVFENTDIGGNFIGLTLPLITYMSFLIGYLFGERPFNVRLFTNIKEGIKI